MFSLSASCDVLWPLFYFIYFDDGLCVFDLICLLLLLLSVFFFVSVLTQGQHSYQESHAQRTFSSVFSHVCLAKTLLVGHNCAIPLHLFYVTLVCDLTFFFIIVFFFFKYFVIKACLCHCCVAGHSMLLAKKIIKYKSNILDCVTCRVFGVKKKKS